jgi:hypothetical protein
MFWASDDSSVAGAELSVDSGVAQGLPTALASPTAAVEGALDAAGHVVSYFDLKK